MFFASIDFMRIIREAGMLIYPLGLCSIVAVFIIAERCYALRQSAVIPEHLSEAIVEGRAAVGGDRRSSLGRILDFATTSAPISARRTRPGHWWKPRGRRSAASMCS